MRRLLTSYLGERIREYNAGNKYQLRQVDNQSAQLQAELWSAVTGPTNAQPTAVSTLVLAGMNDVLNSQGYTQAAWWNRIPIAAWTLMILISVFCNLLVGYGSHGERALILLILRCSRNTPDSDSRY